MKDYRDLEEKLWGLANDLHAEAEDAKDRHDSDEWQYGQGMGFEKASDRIAEILRSHE